MSLTTTDRYPAGQSSPAESFDAFLPAQQFPPERDRNRITQFDRWYRWSQRSYVGLDPSNPQTPQLQFDVDGRRQVRRLSPNLFRFIMEFWSDAVAVDAPVVEYEGGGRQQDFLDRILPSLMRASRLVVGDMVRYGCGVLWARHALMPEALDPRFWFPVRPAYDEHERLGEVVALPFASRANGNLDRLTVYRYPEEGGATRQVFGLEGLTIGGQQGPEEQVAESAAGLVTAVRSREGFYGTSDFLDAAEYVAELHRRETSISEALDRHAKPHLAVPEGSLQVNADGSVTLSEDGMVIPVPEGGELPAYITWEASFEAQENGIARAEQRVLRMSSIAPILATPGEFALRGGLPSGAALRRLAVISVNRLKAIREELSQAWLRFLPANAMLLAEQGGERIVLEPERIRIEWPPEFSTIDDEIEAGQGLPGGDQDGDEDSEAAEGGPREGQEPPVPNRARG